MQSCVAILPLNKTNYIRSSQGASRPKGGSLEILAPPQAPLAVGETLSWRMEEFSPGSEIVPLVAGARRGAVHGGGSERQSWPAHTPRAAQQELRTWLLSPATPCCVLKLTRQTPQVSVRKEAAGFHSVVPNESRSCPPRSSVPACCLLCIPEPMWLLKTTRIITLLWSVAVIKDYKSSKYIFP